MAAASEALAIAIQHHQAGRLPAAEQLYRQILEADPSCADAHHLLGIVAAQVEKHELALECIARAIRLRSDVADYHNHLAKVFYALHRIPEAIGSYRRALELNPHQADAHNNLGLAFKDEQKLDDAIACFRRALALSPNLAEVHANLGLALRGQGKLDEAAASCQRALALNPGLAVAHHTLGLVLSDQGKLNEAVASYARALELNPDFADAHCNLGNAFALQGRPIEAIASFRRAVELQPASTAAHYNLGNALAREARFEDAADAFRRAIGLEPHFALAHNNLGNVLSASGQSQEAVASYETAMRLQPADPTAHGNLLAVLHYCPETTLADLASAHAEFDRRYTAPLRNPAARFPNDRYPDRRLRLGFVSPHFADHPVGRFLIRPLENLDRRCFELFFYSDTQTNDSMTSRIQGTADEWRDVSSINDDQLARRIGADQIDILFDLAGHTPGNRLHVFARKPAPVQITWLDYVGSTGLSAMDYLIADPREVPVEAEPWYNEKVLRLPDDYICYDPPADAPPVGPLPALARGFVTFGSFNILPKLNPPLVALWARILHRVPRSRLLLKNRGWDDPRACDRFRRLFLEHGITPDRLDFRGWSPNAEVLIAYHEIDLALDPFPYNGGLTTCEALWMGVPVITCPGETFASRHGLTHLTAAGAPETIATNLDDYVDRAVSFASNLPRLSTLRAAMRGRMATAPLCDGPRFAAHFTQLLRTAWQSWLESSDRAS